MNHRHRLRSAVAPTAFALALAAACPALAQVTDPDGRVAYPAAWFAAYQPGDALDMAEQVPGFELEDGAAVRGFAGAAGNVVINGQRPNAKSESLAEVLRRIPASQVLRMELVPGRLLGADYQARAQVLNVVLAEAAAATVSGNVEVGAQHVYSGRVTPYINGSLAMRWGPHSFNGALRFENRANPDEGWDILTRADGSLVERRDKVNRYRFQGLTASGGWQWKADDETSHGLNGSAWATENPLRHVSQVSGPGGPLRRDSIDQNPEFTGFEIGGDVTRPLFFGVGKLVFLARREGFVLDETSLNRSLAGDLLGGFHQTADRDTGETLGRLTWTRAGVHGWSLEAGAETALNTLDSDVALFVVRPDGSEVPRALPAAQVQVREVRSEAFVTAARPLSDRLNLETALALEQSNLTVDGDATAERGLIFLKPRLALEWRPTDRWRLRAAIDRTVDQLNFGDFVSSAELANDRVTSGNADIEPERTWRASMLFERKILGDGQVRLTVYNDWVEQVSDRVPTALGVDAPGNLDDGRRTGFDLAADLPLDRLNVPGGRLAVRWLVQDSDVEDPYTGLGRYFSGEPTWFLTVNFRQNLPERKLAWGVDYIADGENANFRLNEIDRFNTQNLNFGVYAEYRPTTRLIATLAVRNIFDREILRNRSFFTPDRSTPEPFAFDDRVRYAGRTVTVTVKRAFG
jgi:hypothetical protein